MSGQTFAWRRRYSSRCSGRTRSRKQYRAIASHLRGRAHKLALPFPAHGGSPMRLATERELIAHHGRRMTADRLVVGTSGNLSVRAGDLLAVTPAGHAYDTPTPALVCVHDLEGSP